ncbi:MAG: hypothetical protein F6K42_24220 [Leptolyngbya sp. SIO1D8]|nr:hypothetical protein [Leptolyngbya sp. SIO1D8]
MNGSVILTYMGIRPVVAADTNDPAAQGLINMGVINNNRELNRYRSQRRGNRLVGHAAFIPPGVQTQLDEFPYASTYEGGNPDVAIHDVPAPENMSQGGLLTAFYVANNMRDGYQFRVVVV